MNYVQAFQLIKDMAYDTDITIYRENEYEIYVCRPSELKKRFEKYDASKNFQIWLRDGDRPFRPNHLRVLIDLNLRVRCRPDLKSELMLAFDRIFYKDDPIEALKEFENEHFDYNLNSINITGVLTQLLLIEQDYGYTSNRESNYDPPSLFLQGWIREFLDSPKEIDNLCMSVCRGQPPMARYTNEENKKSKMHKNTLNPLWYLK